MAAKSPASTRAVGNPDIVIRDAEDADFTAIQAIYAHEVLHGLATFEEVPPTVEDLLSRRASAMKLGLPYLAAELSGKVVGYGYVAPFRPRSAYRFTLEDSVYVAEGLRGKGIGQAILGKLVARCEAGPWRQMIAVIGDTGNAASIALHRKLGFRHAGILDATGFKLGRWVDAVLMQRALGPGRNTPAEHL